MIYLTRVLTNNVEAAKYKLSDSYGWHQELWKIFPDLPDGSPRDFLHRVDFSGDSIIVWIIAPRKPIPPSWGIWETKEVANSFLTHDKYEFSLRANPTVKKVVRLDDGTRKKNGRRTAISSIDELKQWLISQKAPEAGISINWCNCEPPVKEVFLCREKFGTHTRVDFSGVLTVADREKFTHAYLNGIGPAKAFGFGLLLLRPVE